LDKFGYQTFKTTITGETASSFQMVAILYGIPIRVQVEMAPLFAALFAEGSLKWREEQLTKINTAFDALTEQKESHLSFLHRAYRVEEGLAGEQSSIDNRDVFGKNVADDTFETGFDPSVKNPFSDYLCEFAAPLHSNHIELDADETLDGYLPNYSVGKQLFEHISGGDKWAKFALRHGYAKYGEIPDDLWADGAREKRVAWLAEKIPPAARIKQESFDAENKKFFASFNLEPQPTKGPDHAS